MEETLGANRSVDGCDISADLLIRFSDIQRINGDPMTYDTVRSGGC